VNLWVQVSGQVTRRHNVCPFCALFEVTCVQNDLLCQGTARASLVTVYALRFVADMEFCRVLRRCNVVSLFGRFVGAWEHNLLHCTWQKPRRPSLREWFNSSCLISVISHYCRRTPILQAVFMRFGLIHIHTTSLHF